MSTATQGRPERVKHDKAQPVVLSVAFPYAPIGPCAVGGAEVILSEIEAALPDLGFRSVVVAHANSQPQGRLYPTRIPPGEITDAVRAEVERAQQANIDRALAENPTALVHMHGLDFHRYRIPADLPVLVTLHLPPAWYPESIWNLPLNFHLICVSESERRACPPTAQERVTVVQNGVALPDASTLRPEGRYAVMLSRICEEKNLHTGLDAARLARLPVLLAGDVFPYEAHQRYFAEQIQPRLDATGQTHEGRRHAPGATPEARFLGPVIGPAKARLLARAACLLLPSLAPETSSLVAMEALAAGVPVIAVASGAVPEIVEHGRTGFLVDPTGDIAAAMADAIRRLPAIDRHTCRAVAEERFGLTRMLNAYARLYRTHALAAPDPKSASAEITAPANGIQAEPNIHLLTTSEALLAIRDEWASLWLKDVRATPFQHPAWLLPWWQSFGPEGELASVLLRAAGGQLVGLFPVYVYPNPGTDQRQGLLIGAATSDYLDGIFDPACSPAQLAAVCLRAVLQGPGWDTFDLMQLRSDSPLLEASKDNQLPAILPRTEAEPCSVISLTEDLPGKVRGNARRYRRRAEATGPLAFSVARSPEEALASFNQLAQLHRARWELRGEPGVLADQRVMAQHRSAIPELLHAGLLRMFRLTWNSRTLGILYALADPPQRAHRTLYLYLNGIDTENAELSPGTLLLHSVWEYARQEGFAQLDLLRGGEGYKHLWGAQPKPTYGLHAKARPNVSKR